MDGDWLRALVKLERRIVHYDDPVPESAAGLARLEGRLPVLISAPHATRHLRDGAWKREDEYTAALVAPRSIPSKEPSWSWQGALKQEWHTTQR